jgi:hypothetical protein
VTMPHLMNCPHSDTGWCLDCVGAMHKEAFTREEVIDILEYHLLTMIRLLATTVNPVITEYTQAQVDLLRVLIWDFGKK